MASSRIIVIMLMVAVIGGGAGFLINYSISLPQIEKLSNDLHASQAVNQDLRANISQLTSEYNTLQGQYQSLSEANSQTLSQKKSLEAQVIQLNGDLAQKSSQIQVLQSENDALDQKIEIDASLKIFNNITSFYDYVRDTYGLAGDKMGYTARSRIKFGSQLAYHDLGYDVWPNQEATYFEDVGSHSYSTASKIVEYAITRCGINTLDDSVKKIGKILEFINSRINYSYEVDDVYRAPVETLSLSSGDCDDYSILAGALFERVGVDSAISFYTNGQGENHVMVLVHIDNLGSYSFYKFSDLTHLGLRSGTWVIIEPQGNIGYQGDAEWMTQWKLDSAVEIGP
jgi:predicted transglutaminase-like cysteine proteinase